MHFLKQINRLFKAALQGLILVLMSQVAIASESKPISTDQLPECGKEERDALGQLVPAEEQVPWELSYAPNARFIGAAVLEFDAEYRKQRGRELLGHTRWDIVWSSMPGMLGDGTGFHLFGLRFKPCIEDGEPKGYRNEHRYYTFWISGGTDPDQLGLSFSEFDALPPIAQTLILKARTTTSGWQGTHILEYMVDDKQIFKVVPGCCDIPTRFFDLEGEVCKKYDPKSRDSAFCRSFSTEDWPCSVTWLDPRLERREVFGCY